MARASRKQANSTLDESVYLNQQTNPYYPPHNSLDTTVRQQMMVFPDTSKLPSSDDPMESWKAFVEIWGHLIRKCCWDNLQQAICLPESLKGGAYYDEIVTLGISVFSDMPDQYKDMVLRDAFLNGLIECSNRSNLLPSEALLSA